MKSNNDLLERKIIVSFNIGRGGRFNNAGFKSYMGELNFQQLINLESNNCFVQTRDANGRFCKPFITDCNGNCVSDDDVNGEIGTLDFDGQYDTDYAKYIQDCTEQELDVIANSMWYKTQDLIGWLEDNTMHRFDSQGNLIKEECYER